MDPCEITPLQWHKQAEWEVSVAYEMGVRDGIRYAATVIDQNVAAALERPVGHGGPNVSDTVRARWEDLFRRYLGVGVRPAR